MSEKSNKNKKNRETKVFSLKELLEKRAQSCRFRMTLLGELSKQLSALAEISEHPPAEEPITVKQIREEIGFAEADEFLICELNVQERFLFIEAMRFELDAQSLEKQIASRCKDKSGCSDGCDCTCEQDKVASAREKSGLLQDAVTRSVKNREPKTRGIRLVVRSAIGSGLIICGKITIASILNSLTVSGVEVIRI